MVSLHKCFGLREGRQIWPPAWPPLGSSVQERDKGDMHSYSLCELRKANLSRKVCRVLICVGTKDLLMRPDTHSTKCSIFMLQCPPELNTRKLSTSWYSVLTLISIYKDRRAHVNQARLVERKDLQNKLFKCVCTVTYKPRKDTWLVGLGERDTDISGVLLTQRIKTAIYCLWCCTCAVLLSYSEQVCISLQLISKEQSSLHACFSSVFRHFCKRQPKD